MKTLTLEDLKDLDRKALIEHVVSSYEAKREDVEKFDFIVAYESVGSWGCSFFLLRDRETKTLFENHGSHCSCCGFEGQWTPEATTIEYLRSDKFAFCDGGYDDNREGNKTAILNRIRTLRV